MKKLLLIMSLVLCLTGCGYEETKEYPVESIRYYTKTTEEKSGISNVITRTYEYVEFIYIDASGQYRKYTISFSNIIIGDETKAVEEEGRMLARLYMTLEDYEDLITSIEKDE